jgi:hypothetical protein
MLKIRAIPYTYIVVSSLSIVSTSMVDIDITTLSQDTSGIFRVRLTVYVY